MRSSPGTVSTSDGTAQSKPPNATAPMSIPTSLSLEPATRNGPAGVASVVGS